MRDSPDIKRGRLVFGGADPRRPPTIAVS